MGTLEPIENTSLEPIEPGTRLFDRYEVISCLGAGASGVVYKCATFDGRRQLVALKIFSPDVLKDKDSTVRLTREMRLAYRVNHPNVAQYYDLVRGEEEVAIAFEYVEGRNFEELLLESGGLDLRDIINYFSQITAGLKAIHDAGVVHRDLKPSNILISPSGEVKITDFGSALSISDSAEVLSEEDPKNTRIIDSAANIRVTRVGALVGTPNYICPEYILGGAVNYQTDIYALGVIMYEAITGVSPHQSSDLIELLKSKITNDPVPPIELKPECPEELSEIIMSALAKDTEERYLRCDHVLVDLQTVASELYVSQRLDRPNVQFISQAARQPELSADSGSSNWAGILLMVVMLLLIGCLAISI